MRKRKKNSNTVNTHIRFETVLVERLKEMAVYSHNGRYQTLIKDVLNAYVKMHAHVKAVPKHVREMEKQIMELALKDDGFNRFMQ